MRRTDNEIEESIARAIASYPRKDPEKLWDIPVEKSKGTEWYLEDTESAKSSGRVGVGHRAQLLGRRRRVQLLAAMAGLAAAVLAAFIGLQAFRASLRPAATIYLDVNPSVTLEINKKERVMAVRPGNDDGEKILSEMDLVGTDADVAVNALIGSCIRYGYLDEAHAILLISVECGNKEEEKALKERLSVKVTKNLSDNLGGGTVLEQDVKSDEDLRKMEREYKISLGKAALIRKIIADHPELSADSLARMSLSELVQELHKQGIDLRDYADLEGDDYFDDLDDSNEDSERDEDLSDDIEAESDGPASEPSENGVSGYEDEGDDLDDDVGEMDDDGDDRDDDLDGVDDLEDDSDEADDGLGDREDDRDGLDDVDQDNQDNDWDEAYDDYGDDQDDHDDNDQDDQDDDSGEDREDEEDD